MADNLTACQIIIAHHSDMIYSRLCRSSFSSLHFFPVFVYLHFCSFAAVNVKRQTDDGVNVFLSFPTSPDSRRALDDTVLLLLRLNRLLTMIINDNID